MTKLTRQKKICTICGYKMQTGDYFAEHVAENHADKLALFVYGNSHKYKDFEKALYEVFFK